MTKQLFRAALVGALFAAAPARAVDVWDQATEDDNLIGTDNGAVHGTAQVHDLAAESGVVDLDWYVFQNRAHSSYEVIIDGTTGDLNLNGPDVARMIDGLTSAQNSVQLAGYSATLRWQNTTTATDTQWIRVSGSTCATACTAGDQYRFRFYETTYSIPRFDNSDGRVTVIDAATLSALTCSAQFHFYTGPGVYLGSSNSPFNQRVATVLDTSTLAFAAGRSGHVIVSHTCGYGGLAGKAVTLEPATGFAQETQMVSRLP